MRSKRRKWHFRIRHILDAISENKDYIKDMSFEEFCGDTKTLKAVVWNLMTIGEAARHIPPDIEKAYAEVPWPQIRGMRNHVVHGYDRVDSEIVWKVMQDELPPLVPVFEKMLQESSEERLAG